MLLVTLPHNVERPAKPYLLGWALQIGLLLPLIWRRRAPMIAFSVIACMAFVQWWGGVLLPTGDFAVLIALYSVAAYSTLGKLGVAAVTTEIGVALATDQWAPHQHTVKAFILLSGMTTAASVLGLNVKTRRAYLTSLEDRAARLERERDQQAQITAAEERSRIARDVHDIVTHSLSVMVALSDGAAYALPTAPDQAAAAIGKASDIGRQAIAEMQRVLGVLREGRDDLQLSPQPGLRQLDGLLTEVRSAGLPVELVVEGETPRLSSGAELALFRVVQEALTNTRKHAAPGAVARVRLGFAPGKVEVEITDTGPSLPGDGQAGHGLTGMRERVSVYGGDLQAGPRPGGGWRVHARFDAGQLESGVGSGQR